MPHHGFRPVRPTLLLLVAACGVAHAQALRPFTTFRQLHGETRLAVEVTYDAGSLRLVPGRAGELYRMDLAYDERRFVPVSEYDPRSGALTVGVDKARSGGVRLAARDDVKQLATLALSPQVETALALELGAVDADLELGGLRVSELAVEAGASRASIRFSRPNGSRCRRASIAAGAADISVLGLGNSRCEEVEFEGGVGRVLLDFSGRWSADAAVTATMAMGQLTLRLPRDLGVRLTVDKFLARFTPAGLVPHDGGFVSRGYDRATRRLDIDLTTAVGDVQVEWIEN